MDKHNVTYRGTQWTYYTVPVEGYDKLVGVAIGHKFTWTHSTLFPISA